MRYSRFAPGETSAHVYFGEGIDPKINRRVHAAAAQLRAMGLGGVLDLVPGYTSLYIELDGRRTTAGEVQRIVDELPDPPTDEAGPGSLVEIPICYGGRFGPDLEPLAMESHMSAQDVIDLHCAHEYDVFFMGFTPGFAFMGTVDDRIARPRLAVPRQAVPAGSLGIAGNQTGIYPVKSPGGWRLIGMTPLQMVGLSPAGPRMLLQPGDRVRFHAISEEEFSRQRLECAAP